MNIFYSSSISCFTYHFTINVMKVWQCDFPIFFQDFQILFPAEQFKKNHEKLKKKKFC